MTQEEIKAAVLAECERLWQQRKSAVPNTLWHPETNPKNFIDGLYPLSVTPEDDAWIIAPQYGHNTEFTAIALREVQDCNHIVWMLAYRLLGLNKPPAQHVDFTPIIEQFKVLEEFFEPQSTKESDAWYFLSHYLMGLEKGIKPPAHTMARIEQEDL